MNNHHLPSNLIAIANTDKIDAYDVYFLRREFLGDGHISQDEAEHLFALDSSVSDKCREWGHFFSEALVDFTIHQVQPAGIVSEDNAHWLIGQISEDGLVNSNEQMEVLIKILEKAKTAPNFLAKFALEQVSNAVLNNQGPVAKNRECEKNVICRNDVEFIRRVIYGFASDGGMAVTKEEAEFLFDLNDKTVEHKNDPAWSDLFMRAVGNYLLSTMNGSVPISRVELETDLWNEKGNSIASTMVNMLRSVCRETVSNSQRMDENYGRANEASEASMVAASEVTADEAEWVAQRIGADGKLHQNEKALLQFLREESPKLHSSLQALIAQAA